MSVGLRRTLSGCPSASTATWRLRPLGYFRASWPPLHGHRGRVEAALRRWLAAPESYCVVVAEIGGAVSGILAGSMGTCFFCGERVAFDLWFFIRPGRRVWSSGIGNGQLRREPGRPALRCRQA